MKLLARTTLIFLLYASVVAVGGTFVYYTVIHRLYYAYVDRTRRRNHLDCAADQACERIDSPLFLSCHQVARPRSHIRRHGTAVEPSPYVVCKQTQRTGKDARSRLGESDERTMRLS